MELNKLHVWVILQSGLTHQNKGSQSSTGVSTYGRVHTGTSKGNFFNMYGHKYGHRTFTFILHVLYIGWLKTLGGHVHRMVEDTRGTCT